MKTWKVNALIAILIVLVACSLFGIITANTNITEEESIRKTFTRK